VPSNAAARVGSKGDDLRNVIHLADIPGRPLLKASVFMFFDAAVSLLTPLIAGLVTAQILGSNPIPQFALPDYLLIWTGLLLIQAAVRYASTQQLAGAAAAIGARLRLRSYEHLQSLPAHFFDTREHGDILSLLTEDIRRVSQFLTQSATQVAPHLVTVIGATVIVVSTDPLTGLAALCIVPLILGMIRLVGKTASPLSKALAERHAAHVSLLEENLRLQQLIKAYNREKLESTRYQSSNEALMNAELRHQQISNRLAPLVQAASGLAVIGLVWIGAARIASGDLQAAQLVSLIMYGFILFRPLQALGSTYTGYHSALGAAGRIGGLFEETPEPEQADGLPFKKPRIAITVEGVSFAYPGQAGVFEDLHTRFPAGEVSALVGPNGSGKTTLIHLLMRFLSPQKGCIRFDGIDISDLGLVGLRSHIGYVPQQVQLVNGTIAENIRYGLATADEAAIQQAATQALVTDFTDRLPAGLDSPIGPRGVKLSGGQKQRIALARALLKDAPILVLDEPTAMFDAYSEELLLEKLGPALAGKTVILVTHRPTTLGLTRHEVRLRAPAGTGTQGRRTWVE
jgi:ABC-type multidrug transport system fused ATPase/permease subunit